MAQRIPPLPRPQSSPDGSKHGKDMTAAPSPPYVPSGEARPSEIDDVGESVRSPGSTNVLHLIQSKIVTLRDANQSFARCIREVEAGEEFVITRNGTPVARLTPVSPPPRPDAAAAGRVGTYPGADAYEGWQRAPVRSTGTRCMSGERFTLDTNILVYALAGRPDDRRDLAARDHRPGRRCDCWLTLQSVSEFYAAVTRKRLASRSQAAAQANDWLDMFPTATASAAAIRSALAVASAERASYWDALLLATAAEAGCTSMLTEDMADGTALYGVRVLNPFAGDAIPPAVMRLLDHD